MIKTLSFAVMHFSIAFGVACALTGDVVIGGLVAIVEPAVNTVGYYFHEKVWGRIRERRSGVGGREPKRSFASRPISAEECGSGMAACC